VATKPEGRVKAPPVIRSTPAAGQTATSDVLRILPAWIVSVLFHAVILGLFWLVMPPLTRAEPTVEVVATQLTQIEDTPKDVELTNPDMGTDPSLPTNYDIDQLADVSVPGIPMPTETPGIPGGTDGTAMSVPPPPGTGRGTGAGMEGPFSGQAFTTEGLAGGFGGATYVPGGIGGRSGATREKMAIEGGGSAESEARVGQGLMWLALHQAPDGSWSLDRFHQHARDKVGAGAKRFTCNCDGQGGEGNDVAATAMGVLPFLASGITHRNANKMMIDYTKTVDAALKWLIRRQIEEAKSAPSKEGYFGERMYAQGLATIALCEAYGLSSDPGLKVAAQKALDFIVSAQDPVSGGWRYEPRSGGDTSVVGWQVMALKSGQMAGLRVPSPTLDKATKWLDSVQTKDGGGYGYVGPGEAPTMTAVGLLCRQYLGWSPRNPGLLAGVSRLKKTPPAAGYKDIYYYYYATQVVHHMGGESWESWNPKMRELLISLQDQGRQPNKAHLRGSWSPAGDAWASRSGGRIMQTSLSLLTLQVYYRHLPLYRRDLATGKAMK
jgi:hypothetical protein